MYGQAAVRFCHSGAFIRYAPQTKCPAFIKYLDPVNDEELYWPRTYPPYPGMQLRPEEDLGRKTYFKWELYSIHRRPLGAADKRLQTKLIGIMTGTKDELHQRQIESGRMNSYPDMGFTPSYNSA